MCWAHIHGGGVRDGSAPPNLSGKLPNLLFLVGGELGAIYTQPFDNRTQQPTMSSTTMIRPPSQPQGER